MLEKQKLLLLAGFTAMYFMITCLLERRKFLWNDELYTYYIAKLPTMHDVWGALMSGGEQLPPFYYLVTRTSIQLFGLNSLAIRIPEIFGFWVMSICIFLFVARRMSNYYALMAAIFPLLTYTYYYSYEARPYGLVLGFSGLALLSWQSLTISRWRTISLGALTLSLAGALSSHYYGIFALFPIAVGELVRSMSRKKIDLPIWIALVFSLMPFVWHLPLIQSARTYSTAFWSPASWMNIPDFYFGLLYMAAVPLVFILFISWFYHYFRVYLENYNVSKDKMYPPLFEVAASVGYLIVPIICIAIGRLLTGAFTDRYATIAVIGCSLLVTFFTAGLNKYRLMPAFFVTITFIGWFALLAHKNTWAQTEVEALSKIRLLQSKGISNLPIVAADPHSFVEFNHFAPALANRVVYLADPAISLRRLNTNSVEQGMIDLIKPWFGMNVTDYKSYIANGRQFLLCGNPGMFSWIIPQLEADGFRLDLKGFDRTIMLFLVSPPTK